MTIYPNLCQEHVREGVGLEPREGPLLDPTDRPVVEGGRRPLGVSRSRSGFCAFLSIRGEATRIDEFVDGDNAATRSYSNAPLYYCIPEG